MLRCAAEDRWFQRTADSAFSWQQLIAMRLEDHDVLDSAMPCLTMTGRKLGAGIIHPGGGVEVDMPLPDVDQDEWWSMATGC